MFYRDSEVPLCGTEGQRGRSGGNTIGGERLDHCATCECLVEVECDLYDAMGPLMDYFDNR